MKIMSWVFKKRIGNNVKIAVSVILIILAIALVCRLAFEPYTSVTSSIDSDETVEWHAFLVATNHYDVSVRNLKYAEADVDELYRSLRALGVKDENITVLKSSNYEFSLGTSKESIEDGYNAFLAKLNERSAALVYLSGHGFCQNNWLGRPCSYYAPSDFQFEKKNAKKVSIDRMMKDLAKTKARFKWMCVDACRDPLDRGISARSLSIDNIPSGVVLTQSCKLGQQSFEAGEPEGAPFENGLFTRAFVDAVNGRALEADADQNGVLTLGELRDYLSTRVPRDAQNYLNAKQNPVFTSIDRASLDEFADYPLFDHLRIMERQLEDRFTVEPVDGGCMITGVNLERLRRSVIIPQQLRGMQVVAIGKHAFYGYSSLTSVDIPRGVKTIGDQAFWGCSSLTNFVIPDGVTSIGRWAFGDCSSLASVTIPEGVESIGDIAFKNCSALTTLNIPNSVAKIGDNAFENSFVKLHVYKGSYAESWSRSHNFSYEALETDAASNVEDSEDSASPEEWFETRKINGGVAITGFSSAESYHIDISIPPSIAGEKVLEIDEHAFDHTDLTNVIIPNGVRKIGEGAFWNCSYLKSIVIPKTVRRIENNAFQDCSSLTDLVIPECVEYIGMRAFSECTSLTKVTIPKCVMMIDGWSFSPSSAVIEVDPANPKYSSENGVLFDKKKEKIYHFPANDAYTTYVIPSSVKYIDDWSFHGCSSLTSVVIPEGVKSISNGSFCDCTSLSNVKIPESVERIGAGSFDNCVPLENLFIPEGVTKIDVGSFEASGAIVEVDQKNINYSSIDGVLFDKNQEKLLHFPNSSSRKSYTTPDSVKVIVERSFSNNMSIRDVVLSKVEIIDEMSFYQCTSLRNITLPEGLKSIGSYAFGHCKSLENVVLPNSIMDIDDKSFYECPAKLRVYKRSYAETWAREHNREYETID